MSAAEATNLATTEAPRSEAPDAPEADTPGVLSLLRKIKDGTVSPVNLSADSRRALVEYLSGDGYSVAEIAEIVKASERTIARDRVAIVSANAVQRDPNLLPQIVGRLLREAEASVQRIRRVTRERDTPPAVRIEGESRCFTILCELAGKLQSLGYLPSATQQLKAEVTHRLGELPEGAELQAELQRLEALRVELAPQDPQLADGLTTLQGQAKLVTLKQTISVTAAQRREVRSVPANGVTNAT